MNWLRRHRRILFLITVGGFLVGIFVSFGTSLIPQGEINVLAKVNGKKIPYRYFQNAYRQALDQERQAEKEKAMTEKDFQDLRWRVFQQLVREEIFYQEAKKYGIRVTNQELSSVIQSYNLFHENDRFDRRKYKQIVRFGFGMTMDEFEEARRREIFSSKLQAFIANSVKVSREEIIRSKKASISRLNQQIQTTQDSEIRKNLLEEIKRIKTASWEDLRESMWKEQVNQVMNEWLNQINSKLKIEDLAQVLQQGAPQQQ